MGLHDIHWYKHGKCSRQPELVDLFYSWDYAEQEQAKTLCSECPVSVQCLAHAYKNGEEGIWGGMTAKEREDALVTSTIRATLLTVERRNMQREQSHLVGAFHEPLFDISFPQSHTLQALSTTAEESVQPLLDQLEFPPHRSPSESPSDPNQMLPVELYQVELESPQLQSSPSHPEMGGELSILGLSFDRIELEYISDLVA
jgi:hypothetical protein